MVTQPEKPDELKTLDPSQAKTFLPREGSRRNYKPQGLAKIIPKLARKVAGKRPTLISDLKENWEHVVGEELAYFTRPAKLTAGTLHIEMALGAGPIVAMRQEDMLARVQLHLGKASILRLTLHQADFPLIARENDQELVKKETEALTEVKKSNSDGLSLRAALADLKSHLDRRHNS